MSTFNGLVEEFPNIRIDYFRQHPGKPPPAALFLSHVHSDHLMGLESVKMPFVYCSATTKRILLKMEKYPHRINFAKGILEARKQHYRHLKTVLRALPMNFAAELELGPKSTIRVTLLDANHCPGAVMFLIEGDGKAIVYTGDIRAEAWWVNSIVQNPVLLPYTCGLKRLDCIYLDTTFATHDEQYRDFPTKADGLRELLEKVGQCPPDTIFYFRAWTLGYENVWLALSNFLKSRIHVNQYQLRIFRDEDSGNNESAALTGFTVGNSQLLGCLTLDRNARIHSCEPGLECHSEIKKMKNAIWITPIISRLKDGTELRELGAGGGWRDLYPTAELKLEDSATLQQLLSLCAMSMGGESLLSKMEHALGQSESIRDLSMALDEPDDLKFEENGSIKVDDIVSLLSERLKQEVVQAHRKRFATDDRDYLPRILSISLTLVIHPTMSFAILWSEELSMQALFGDLCSEHTFYFDQQTRELVAALEERTGSGTSGKRKRDDDEDTQKTESQHIGHSSPIALSSPVKTAEPEDTTAHHIVLKEESVDFTPDHQLHKIEAAYHQHYQRLNSDYLREEFNSDFLSSSAFDSQLEENLDLSDGDAGKEDPQRQEGRDEHTEQERVVRKQARIEAYNAARLALFRNNSTEWNAIP